MAQQASIASSRMASYEHYSTVIEQSNYRLLVARFNSLIIISRFTMHYTSLKIRTCLYTGKFGYFEVFDNKMSPRNWKFRFSQKIYYRLDKQKSDTNINRKF